MKFSGPYISFLEQLATPLVQHPVMYPKHYCSKFHPKYNPKVADEVKAAGTQDLERVDAREVWRYRSANALG